MEKIICVVLFAFLASAQGFQDCIKCPKVATKYPFDLEKFMGEWYPVLIKPIDEVEAKLSCSKFTLSAVPVGNTTQINLRYTAKLGDKEGTSKAIARPIHPLLTSQWMEYIYPKNEEDKASKGLYTASVLATDYTSYCLAYACKEYFNEKTDSFEVRTFVIVAGRTQTLHPEVLKTLKSAITGLDVNESDLIQVDRANC